MFLVLKTEGLLSQLRGGRTIGELERSKAVESSSDASICSKTKLMLMDQAANSYFATISIDKPTDFRNKVRAKHA